MSEHIDVKGRRAGPDFPLGREDFMSILSALGGLPIPDDYEEARQTISDRALHAGMVSLVAAYINKDGSVTISPITVAHILSSALKYIDEHQED